MKAVSFTYVVPLPDPDDVPLADDETAIAYAREALEELIADEGFQAEGAVISDIDRNNHQLLIPVETSLAALARLSAAQNERLRTLVTNWKADRIRVFADDYETDNLLFTLFRGSRAELTGLIEPDGRAHT